MGPFPNKGAKNVDFIRKILVVLAVEIGNEHPVQEGGGNEDQDESGTGIPGGQAGRQRPRSAEW